MRKRRFKNLFRNGIGMKPVFKSAAPASTLSAKVGASFLCSPFRCQVRVTETKPRVFLPPPPEPRQQRSPRLFAGDDVRSL